MVTFNANIRILLADDHRLFRRAVRQLIESAPALHIVSEADDGDRALAELQRYEPDVAILDLQMPGLDGLEVARAVRRLHLSTVVIVLTAHMSKALVESAARAGVAAYVPKDRGFVELLDCVAAVASGRPYFSPQLPDEWRPSVQP